MKVNPHPHTGFSNGLYDFEKEFRHNKTGRDNFRYKRIKWTNEQKDLE